jgi:trehalose synthase
MTRMTETSDQWWKTAVIYCLDVETFFDSDDDGVGDVSGLVDRIDYLAQLGVTCLWLMPFYPTPDRDDGYDVMDFYGVDPRLGSHGDVVELIRTAKDRGIRVIVDLLINHTSDQHPWFKAARRSKTNRFRDYYVWRSDAPPDTSHLTVFPDEEDGIWTLDERTGEWYLHHFYSHQPDLNVANPAVRDEIMKVVGFWLQLGIDGFRVDAVPFFLEDEGMTGKDADAMAEPHEHLRDIRAFLSRRRGEAIMLGEVNVPREEQVLYFGDGDQLHMMFDFVTMQQMYLSLARGDARPLTKALVDRPEIPEDCQWATFVRNHDELTLDKLSESEREEVFAAFGPEEHMQIFGRGLKRRVPPMLGGDPRRVRLVYSLLFSLPGTPAIFYGEEIGMGEDLEAEGRMAVRTPMQWSAEKNGGFSSAPPSRLVARLVPDGFGPQFVNVHDQMRDPDSLWNFVRLLAQTYRSHPELGRGRLEVLDQPHPEVLAHCVAWHDRILVAAHNLGADPREVTLRLEVPEGSRLEGLLTPEIHELDEKGEATLSLEGFGYQWFHVHLPERLRLP